MRSPMPVTQNFHARISGASLEADPNVVSIGCQTPARTDTISPPAPAPVASDVAVIDPAIIAMPDGDMPTNGTVEVDVPRPVDVPSHSDIAMNIHRAVNAGAAMAADMGSSAAAGISLRQRSSKSQDRHRAEQKNSPQHPLAHNVASTYSTIRHDMICEARKRRSVIADAIVVAVPPIWAASHHGSAI